MNRFINIFLLAFGLVLGGISNARAGTDIINNLLLKAGNVIDNVSLEYQKISLELSKITTGKLFQLDDTTSDLIRNLIDDYNMIEAKIARVKNDIDLVRSVYQDAVDYYNDAVNYYNSFNERMTNIKNKAEDLLEKRGWKKHEISDNDNSDESESDNEITLTGANLSEFDAEKLDIEESGVIQKRSSDDDDDNDDEGTDNFKQENNNTELEDRNNTRGNSGRGNGSSNRGENNSRNNNDSSDNNDDSDIQSANNTLNKTINNENNTSLGLISESQSVKRRFIMEDDNTSDQPKENNSSTNSLSENLNVKK